MKKVILAGICLRSQQKSFASSMEECERLCEACGYEIVEKLTRLTPLTEIRLLGKER